jgi:hypothetical protein
MAEAIKKRIEIYLSTLNVSLPPANNILLFLFYYSKTFFT